MAWMMVPLPGSESADSGNRIVRKAGARRMASRTDSDAGYRRITLATHARALHSVGTWVRQWFRVWRWPAGVVAGLVLWLALVAVVGAATSVGVFRSSDWPGDDKVDVNGYNANVINVLRPVDARVVTTIFAMSAWKCGIDCRPGLPPRP